MHISSGFLFLFISYYYAPVVSSHLPIPFQFGFNYSFIQFKLGPFPDLLRISLGGFPDLVRKNSAKLRRKSDQNPKKVGPKIELSPNLT
ncbi:hypothetical protein CHT99_10560 [Sphingobacterium cellulitidis]|nr:hypothetical protein CHT99_10560 [Sphingobacterium cellulitidis]